MKMALNNCRNFLWVFRRYSSFPGTPKTLEDCYSLFFLDHTCSIEELRAAYTTTVKRYSDSIENVREIDRAYYRILRDLKETEVVRIREHPEDAAVSSRRYINYEGLGREVNGTRPALSSESEQHNQRYHDKKKIYSGHFTRGSASVEAMVEGMVSVNIDEESLKDLPGAGKPLKDKSHRSPFIDPLSYKLNEIMINQNVGTEWIEMKKEIDLGLKEANVVLTDYKKKLERKSIDEKEWQEALKAFREKIVKINKVVWNYNMAVPVLRMQRAEYRADRLIQKMEAKWELEKKNWKT